LIIFDNHLHLDPAGRNVEAAKDFRKAGGTHFVLSHMPYRSVRIKTGADYREQFRVTLDMAERVRAETDVGVFVTLGPYPVDLVRLAEKMPLAEAKAVLLEGMEIAAGLVREGEAIALGEIGRPHFPTSPEIVSASNEILEHGMRLAKEAGCPVVLHTESTTPETCLEFAGMADRAGLTRDKVVKHYSPPLIKEEENHGLFPSVLASKKAVESAIGQGTRFMMETDYIDDPKRPGAVLNCNTIPKRVRSYLDKGLFTEESVAVICKDNPERVYGIRLEE